MESSNNNQIIKIITVGEFGVGKTSIIVKFCDNKFFSTPITNLGKKYYSKKLNETELEIWDTEGQERYGLMNQYYYGSKGVLLVFDITNKESFEKIKNFWLNNVKGNIDNYNKIVIYIIGNKSEEKNRNVYHQDVKAFFPNYKYIETSAKSGENIDKVFNEILHDITHVETNPCPISENHYKNGLISKPKDIILEKEENCCKKCWRSVCCCCPELCSIQ